MMQKIQFRFVLFTMLVISLVLGAVSLVFFMTSSNANTHHRTLFLLFIILFLVLIASVIFSWFAMKPIRKSWQQQLDFTADASHELRTPLSIIQSNLEIVQDNPEETVASQEQWLTNIHTEVIRMNQLVDDLLTLSRADTAAYDITQTDFPIELIIRERVASFQVLAEQIQIVFQTSLEDNLMLSGDPLRITQLFTILIDNALHYIGRPGTISITACQVGKHIKINFCDDGIGIPTKEVPKVFTRFYRVDKVRARNLGGSGLGLPIAKWIVEAHGGKISMKSDTNLGVTIQISFP